MSRPRYFESVGGYKLQTPTNSLEEKVRVALSRVQLWSQLSSPRSVSRSLISEGQYGTPTVVDKSMGKLWGVFGVGGPNSSFSLRNEEALYLTESNQVSLSWNGVPLSVQQAHSLYLNKACSFAEYRVFSNLNRLGFRVFRLPKKELGPFRPLKRRFVSSTDAFPLPITIKKPKLMSNETSMNLFPHLLPPNTKNSPVPVSDYDYSLEDSFRQGYRGFYHLNDFNQPYKNVSKSEVEEEKDEDVVPFAYGKIQPLLSPQDRNSLADVYKRLDIFTPSEVGFLGGAKRAVFDVFCPTTRFKKKSPGEPDYKVAINSSESDVPMDLNVLCSSDSKLIQGIVTPSGSLSYYRFMKVSLPTDLTTKVDS